MHCSCKNIVYVCTGEALWWVNQTRAATSCVFLLFVSICAAHENSGNYNVARNYVRSNSDNVSMCRNWENSYGTKLVESVEVCSAQVSTPVCYCTKLWTINNSGNLRAISRSISWLRKRVWMVACVGLVEYRDTLFVLLYCWKESWQK